MSSITLPLREKEIQHDASKGSPKISFGHDMRKQFLLDDDYVNLNHGILR